MAGSTVNRPRVNLLPPGARAFLGRRVAELAGLALIAVAGVALAALASYDAADPSLNTATPKATANWLGGFGATAADLGYQSLGLAAMALPLVLAVWGWRLAAHRGLSRPWLRLVLLPPTVALAALALAGVVVPAAWPLTAGLGGLAGDGLMAAARAGLALLPVAVPAALLVIVAGVLALVGLVLVLGFRAAEYWHFGRGTWRLAGRSARLAAARAGDLKQAAGNLRLRRREPHFGADDEDDEDGYDEPVAPTPEVAKPKRKRVTREAKPAKASRRAKAEAEPLLDFGDGGKFALPPLHLLQEQTGPQGPNVSDDALEQNARLLETVLDDYGVRGAIAKVRPGPVVTLYELEPAPGTKTSRVIGLSDDIARSMSAIAVRVATVPGRSVIGIELPNSRRETVYLRALLATKDYEKGANALTLALGKDIGGTPVLADLAKMPHLLIAGTTGSGKSVAINTMILSLLYRLTPEQCRLILIDPKMLELSVYDDIPHLLAPVVTDPSKAVVALKWAVREMENRYKAMARLGVRNISGYNQRLAEAKARGEPMTRTVQTGYDQDSGEPIYEDEQLDLEPFPFIVVVVDEMADLMMVAGKDIEGAVQRLAQMARAAGIHVIMATQRPSVDVITGTIKANFPTRISFQVTSKIDSRTILGEQGAEQLLGMGDMLYMAGGGRIQRVHGPFVSDEEVETIVNHLKAQGVPEYLDAVTEDEDEADMGADGAGGSGSGADDDGADPYDQAVAIVIRDRKASTSYIQRRLGIGYNRAATLIERMEDEGVIGPANHAGKREILVPSEEERLAGA
ncbi:MAG: DNA translocase FtsK 4TM domain-containing protein [Alphaproteobacteria bacterium]